MKLNDRPDPRLVWPIDAVFHEPIFLHPALLQEDWDAVHMDMDINGDALLFAIFGGQF